MCNSSYRADVPWGAYPERRPSHLSWLDQQGEGILRAVRRCRTVRRASMQAVLRAVNEQAVDIGHPSEAALRQHAAELKVAVRRHGLTATHIARIFALVREAATLAINQRPYDVQLWGGWVLLHGMVAEMDTGEGKTLTATLPACAVAFTGNPVHIITVNEYLATRDAEWMRPIYHMLGLSIGVIHENQKDPQTRRHAYAADITYCTNKQVAFDYLRDSLIKGQTPRRLHFQLEKLAGMGNRQSQLMLRGLYYAIVDEADSVLIDEARTPLILSQPSSMIMERQACQQALVLAKQFVDNRDFVIDAKNRAIQLTAEGRSRLSGVTTEWPHIWKNRRMREELLRQALRALHLFHPEVHYLVRDGKVHIIDEYTGRTMPDRSWEGGLHQLIEAKEGCAVNDRLDPVARITYQRFFRRYQKLGGMTGTAREVARELWSVYQLPVVKIPTNRPLCRRQLPTSIHATTQDKLEALLRSVKEIHQQYRPILIGTRTVAASQRLSELLTASHLEHQILNAKQDQDEATIIAGAGHAGRITVATNMAGRGTDIQLGPGVAEIGGLHVIASEPHEARRIDRQLFGRCGRQGDPGSFQLFVSLEDDMMRTYGHPMQILMLRWAGRLSRPLGRRIGAWITGTIQKAVERHHRRIRKQVLLADKHLDALLAFSGQSE